MINFQTENVAMPDIDPKRVGEWLGNVAALHGRRLGNITYCFCDDEYILDANRKFIDHDYYTDIITFDYSTPSRIAGDILISLDTVRSNAESLDEPYGRELLRVIIHGVLHLCGIDDKAPGARAGMEAAENEALNLYDQIND